MLRVMLFTAQDSPLGDLAPDEVRALVRHDAVNSEHYIDITTTRTLEKGWRIVYRDAMGKWREYVVDGIDQAHAEGAPVGTYRCVWSVQHDLMGVPCDKMPGVQTPVSAQLALDAALSLTSRWVRGTVTQSTTAGASMWRMSAWSALGVLVENWGGEVAATIEVGRDAVSARKVDLLSHAGKEQPTRRFEYGADVTGIQRKVADSPNVSRIIPLGASEQTDTGGNGRKIDITSVNSGREYLENAAVRNAYRLPDGQGGWEHPTAYVENPEADTPAKLKAWAQANLQSYTVPQVSYTASVAAFEAAGLDAKGIAEGDAVQVVDDDMGLRVEARVQSLDVNELMPTDQQVTIGNISQALPSMLSSLSSKVGRAVETVQIINGDGFNTEGWLERTRERMNAEANATGGYTYITQGQGIRTYDVAVADPQSGLEANQVVEVKGGTIRIADSKTSSGGWDWKTVIESGHIAADLVTAAHITAGYIGSAGGTFIDLDNDLVQLGESDGVHVYIDSNGLGIDPANVNDATLTGGSLTSFTATGTRIGRYAMPHVFVNDTGFGVYPASTNADGAAYLKANQDGILVRSQTSDNAYTRTTSYGTKVYWNNTEVARLYTGNGPDPTTGFTNGQGLLRLTSSGQNDTFVTLGNRSGQGFALYVSQRFDKPTWKPGGFAIQPGQSPAFIFGAENSGAESLDLKACLNNDDLDDARTFISLKEGNSGGDAMLAGAGALTIVGGGEYPAARYAVGDMAATSENLLLGADSAVYIESNGNAIANRKTWEFATSGIMTTPGSIYTTNAGYPIRNTNTTVDTTLDDNGITSNANSYLAWLDKNGKSYAWMTGRAYANGTTAALLTARKPVNGANVDNALVLSVANDGTRGVAVSDAGAWRTALGLGSTTKSSTIANNATAAANINLTSVEYASWGKTAMVRIRFTTTVARSGNWNVCTMASGKRPAYVAGVTCWAKPTLTGNMSAAGVVQVSGDVAANTDMVVLATYVLA